MNGKTTGADWSDARGQKWRTQLAGMEAMLAPVDEALISCLKLSRPLKIAEIGCGGGGTTFEILRLAPSGSVVHGFDISPTLIDLARSRKPADEHAIAFHIADMATALPQEGTYDRLASRFGIMFFGHPLSAFANLVRWLAPGGCFAFAVWGTLEANPWMSAVHKVVSDVIDLPLSDPEAPGPFRYGKADKLLALLDRAGFDKLDVREWRSMFAIGGGLPAAEAARFALASFSSFDELLSEAGDEHWNEAHRLLTARFVQHEEFGTVRLGGSVHLVTGTRPNDDVTRAEV